MPYMRNINKTGQALVMKPEKSYSGLEHAREVLFTLLDGYKGTTSIQLWGDAVLNVGTHTQCSLVFKQPGVLRELLLKQDILKLGEAYLNGGIDVEGEMESLFDLAPWIQSLKLPLRKKIKLLCKVLCLPATLDQCDSQLLRASSSARSNSRASISHHYDVSNAFYKLWLDPQMVYSCGYFSDQQQSLADAQCDKLDYICRKLRLQPEQKLLDIGCGWGALMLWAAKYYGVHSHGITLSQQQYNYAQQRIRNEGLQDRVTVELRDYRDMSDAVQYDRIVSVGMFEHVGVKNFPVYFGMVKSLLKPGGVFLNHGITNDTGWLKTDLTRFINHYVFPDGELARISDVSSAMENAGFEILDVESLRRHYAMTLRHWVKALEKNRQAAVGESSESTYRLWRLYMSGSAYYFDQGSINVYQLLAGHAHDAVSVPLRRDDMYSH